MSIEKETPLQYPFFEGPPFKWNHIKCNHTTHIWEDKVPLWKEQGEKRGNNQRHSSGHERQSDDKQSNGTASGAAGVFMVIEAIELTLAINLLWQQFWNILII